ncbi:MAG: aldehyde ferredoxin oxidoreductase family protein [Chloroflexi bacterium]|nr:aldehyde ferredoxin oxidoreductase family protein [Chloroflexota bacterium]
MSFGYHRRILRVNLTDGQITVETPDDVFYRRYLGGAGFVAYYLLKEVPPDTDPLGPGNRLIFACGPLTGAPLAGSGRNAIGARSPLTGAMGESEVGGFWGAELKAAGFDAIIVEGQASSPVYLWVHDGEVELRDAAHLWGLENKPTHTAIRKELGEKRARVALCGPAGEKLVRYANIMADLKHAAGRTGLGAVMGSKKLKAVAVRGTGKLPLAHPTQVGALARWMRDNYRDLMGKFPDLGTGVSTVPYNRSGALPVHNFRDGHLDGADVLGREGLAEHVVIRMESCYACVVGCKKVAALDEPYPVDQAYGGPEYETATGLGSNCGVTDVYAVTKASERCNALGLDTISAGGTIAFAMECYEEGLLTAEDTGGLDLRFGNAETMLQLLELIAARQGIGDLLAEGSKRAAERIGGGAERFAVHVKGQELPYHDPRIQHGLGLGYAISYTGADHMHNAFDSSYEHEAGLDSVRNLGVLEPMPATWLGPEKVRAVIYGSLRRHLDNCLVLCNFLPYRNDQVVEAVRAVTGWDTNAWELWKAAERLVTMARAFNVRQGFTPADDRLPPRMSEPLGPGAPIDPAAVEAAQPIYYEMMGWDPVTGVPRAAKLHELGIGWVASLLELEGSEANCQRISGAD